MSTPAQFMTQLIEENLDRACSIALLTDASDVT